MLTAEEKPFFLLAFVKNVFLDGLRAGTKKNDQRRRFIVLVNTFSHNGPISFLISSAVMKGDCLPTNHRVCTLSCHFWSACPLLRGEFTCLIETIYNASFCRMGHIKY